MRDSGRRAGASTDSLTVHWRPQGSPDCLAWQRCPCQSLPQELAQAGLPPIRGCMLTPLAALDKTTVLALPAGGLVAAAGGACKMEAVPSEGICTQTVNPQERPEAGAQMTQCTADQPGWLTVSSCPSCVQLHECAAEPGGCLPAVKIPSREY